MATSPDQPQNGVSDSVTPQPTLAPQTNTHKGGKRSGKEPNKNWQSVRFYLRLYVPEINQLLFFGLVVGILPLLFKFFLSVALTSKTFKHSPLPDAHILSFRQLLGSGDTFLILFVLFLSYLSDPVLKIAKSRRIRNLFVGLFSALSCVSVFIYGMNVADLINSEADPHTAFLFSNIALSMVFTLISGVVTSCVVKGVNND